tara:strand:- start:3527 stop:3925 length:399 start_codon:yes stop_codon:yes gene_type:complete
MKFTKVELPSNKKFGFFFTLVFTFASVYFFFKDSSIWAYTFTLTSVILLLITIIKAEALLPLNKIWLRFGLLLGMIVSPIVLGIIFFGLFTPIAFLMRIIGRDELRLKFKDKTSHWISRNDLIQSDSFKQQF